MPTAEIVLDGAAIERALARISRQIFEANPKAGKWGVIGLTTRGFPLAQRLAVALRKLGLKDVPVGELDITFHRDDLETRHPVPHATNIPFDLTERLIILVDDVLFSGRSVRAALTALGDFGRPAAIRLVVLIDRGHRQLPIQADYVGHKLTTHPADRVAVHLKEVDGTDSVEVVAA